MMEIKASIQLTDQDRERVQRVIDSARLELELWHWLSPSQQQSLVKKIQRFQEHLEVEE